MHLSPNRSKKRREIFILNFGYWMLVSSINRLINALVPFTHHLNRNLDYNKCKHEIFFRK